MSKIRPTPADEALAKLRVARGTLTGVRECLADALEFVNRGIHTVEDCHARMTEALTAAGVPVHPARPAQKKAPAKRAGARRRRTVKR